MQVMDDQKPAPSSYIAAMAGLSSKTHPMNSALRNR